MSQEIAWSGVHARVGSTPADARRRQTSRHALRAADGADIVIEPACAAQLASLDDNWRDLTRRAEATNVFMHPALLRAALDAYPDRHIRVLLAWQRSRPARLVGLWAFAIGAAPQSMLPLPVLSAPPTPNAYLATPVIDRDCLDAALDAFLNYIAGEAALPQIVAIDPIGTDTATFLALARVVAARHGAIRVFGRAQRPMLASGLDGKTYLERALSGASRKKLRQHRRRLAERGSLAQAVVTEPDAVGRAFEAFLALEAAGWKGRHGTALLSDPADAAFARAMIAALARHGDAAIHSLVLDGKPISMQVVLRDGATAFTWKTAYDEALHDYSPGVLLFEDYTAHLLADPTVERVDSCSFDDSGYMAAWQERAGLAQLWLDTRPGGSVAFAVATRWQAAYLAARACAKTLYRRHWRRKGR